MVSNYLILFSSGRESFLVLEKMLSLFNGSNRRVRIHLVHINYGQASFAGESAAMFEYLHEWFILRRSERDLSRVKDGRLMTDEYFLKDEEGQPIDTVSVVVSEPVVTVPTVPTAILKGESGNDLVPYRNAMFVLFALNYIEGLPEDYRVDRLVLTNTAEAGNGDSFSKIVHPMYEVVRLSRKDERLLTYVAPLVDSNTINEELANHIVTEHPYLTKYIVSCDKGVRPGCGVCTKCQMNISMSAEQIKSMEAMLPHGISPEEYNEEEQTLVESIQKLKTFLAQVYGK